MQQATATPARALRRLTLTAGLAVGAALAGRLWRGSTRQRRRHGAPLFTDATVRRRITIRRPLGDVFRAWQAVELLPRFLTHLASVTRHGDRSHWVALTPRGRAVEWDMHVVETRENERLVWEGLPAAGAAVPMRLTAQFRTAPADRGTELTVRLECLPTTAIGHVVAAATARELARALHCFRQWMEAGEVATVDGQPTGMQPETRRLELRRVRARGRRRGADLVELASADSFPASDPPASRMVT